jgi:hypothetical protein
MSSEETTADGPVPTAQPSSLNGSDAAATDGDGGSRRLSEPLAMGAAGLLAGLVVWLILESVFPIFRVPEEVLKRIPLSFAPPDVLADFAAEKQKTDLWNALSAGLLLGTLASMAFAFVQGLLRRQPVTYLSPAICIAGGAATGAVAGLASQWGLSDLMARTEPLTAAVLIQTVFWAILGAGAGAGTGLFSGSLPRFAGLMGQGLVAGALFGLLYAVAAACAFPVDDAERLIPASPANRAVWTVVGIAVVGLLLGASSSRRRHRKAT